MKNSRTKKLHSVYVVVSKEKLKEEIKNSVGKSTILGFCGGATDRVSAVDEIVELKPEIIITETYMPFVDICSFVKKITVDPSYDPKIYALIGADDANQIELLLKNGVRHCILIPSSAENVADAVERDILMMDSELELKIFEVFKELGLTVNSAGYRYLKKMIMVGYYDLKRLNCVSKYLYPEMAEEFNTSPASVERSMRNVIEKAWANGSMEIWKKYFENPDFKPTVKEFVAEIINMLKFGPR
ncbi:MAG: sporulation initiation factor Spo0A C-terminal domain-containing protein [Clostridia bacterium]|nr:sporulation initiation factor Spo0A C-terminal domain-containing protein [Clostridia bacterium]